MSPHSPVVIANTGVIGRTGSTLSMALLATAPGVTVPGDPPFEVGLIRWLAQRATAVDPTIPVPASRRTDSGRSGGVLDVARRALAMVRDRAGSGVVSDGGVVGLGRSPAPASPQVGAQLRDLDPDGSIAAAELRAVVAGTVELVGGVGLAEKMPVWARDYLVRSGVATRTLWRIRDPRDTWASVRAVDARRGRPGFGRGPYESEDTFLERFIADHIVYFDRLASESGTGVGEEAVIVRYEDLVLAPDTVAASIGALIGTSPDVSAALATLDAFRSGHGTSADPVSSIGRFRHDLSIDHRERLESALAPYLVHFGYGDGGAATGPPG